MSRLRWRLDDFQSNHLAPPAPTDHRMRGSDVAPVRRVIGVDEHGPMYALTWRERLFITATITASLGGLALIAWGVERLTR